MNNLDLKNINNIHFLGIGGIGVSALARMMLHEGKKVSGSDMKETELTKQLAKEGIKISYGQDISDIPEDTNLIVYSIALRIHAKDFMKKVEKLEIPMLTYPEMLGLVSKDKYTITVSGTHGKTTTTAMLAKILIDAGIDPTVIVGSILPETNSNFVAGKSKYFLVEACEYERSFLNMHPNLAIITNIDEDHLDYYKDIDDIKNAFSEFAGRVSEDGFIIYDKGDKNSENVLSDLEQEKDGEMSFLGQDLELQQPGEYNRKNASMAITAAVKLGIDANSAKESLKKFKGTWRRLEYKGKTMEGTLVYDDYAHNHTEIRALLSGVREAFPEKKSIAVFQPHLFSRTKALLTELSESFDNANEIIIADIYPAREEFDPTINSEMLVDKLVKNKQDAKHIDSFEKIVGYLRGIADKDSLIMTIGAGDILRVGESLISE